METINQFYNRTNDNKESITGYVSKYIKEYNLSYTPELFSNLLEQLKEVYNRELASLSKLELNLASEISYRSFQHKVSRIRKGY